MNLVVQWLPPSNEGFLYAKVCEILFIQPNFKMVVTVCKLEPSLFHLWIHLRNVSTLRQSTVVTAYDVLEMMIVSLFDNLTWLEFILPMFRLVLLRDECIVKKRNFHHFMSTGTTEKSLQSHAVLFHKLDYH